MRPLRRFLPSPVAPLEGRVALSHAGVVAEVARHLTPRPSHVTVQGPYVTTVQAGVDAETATLGLTGSVEAPTVGTVSVSGTVSNSVVFPRRRSHTQGALTLTSANYPGETVVLGLAGPYVDLAPGGTTTVRLNVVVRSAPGQLAAYIGRHGHAALTLVPTNGAAGGPSPTHTSAGDYVLTLSR
jgi:hypothetical protein